MSAWLRVKPEDRARWWAHAAAVANRKPGALDKAVSDFAKDSAA